VDVFHFAVKIDFEGKSSGVKYCPAVLAITQMALDVARNLRCQPTLQVFAD
jgi:hypothetical protein